MADEPYYTPGQSDGIPPQSLTEFTPKKPLGVDPVSPLPLPEGSEIDRHAQLFAFDSSSGQFKPVSWQDGSLMVAGDVFAPIIDTHITRDPATNLVSLVAETDGVRTKNSVFTRDPDTLLVTRVQEVLV